MGLGVGVGITLLRYASSQIFAVKQNAFLTRGTGGQAGVHRGHGGAARDAGRDHLQQPHRRLRPGCRVRPCLTKSVCKVVLQKSIPAQIRQLIIYYSNNTG